LLVRTVGLEIQIGKALHERSAAFAHPPGSGQPRNSLSQSNENASGETPLAFSPDLVDQSFSSFLASS
jgi:hypothetical protein